MNDQENALAAASKTAVKEVSKFLEKIVGPPLEELGLLFKDQIKMWRFNNQIRILQKTQKTLEEKGIEPRRVPLRILVPLLDVGSLEEEPNMQAKWSALLAKAADPEYSQEHVFSFLHILNQLSPKEAAVLDMIFSVYESIEVITRNFLFQDHTQIIKELNLSHEDYSIILQRLESLSLLISSALPGSTLRKMESGDGSFIKRVYVSELGNTFVRYCRNR